MIVKFTNTTKRENSTYIPTTFTKTYNNVYLKNESSIIKPILEMDRTTTSHAYNYCYISEFNRYYFVRDIVYNNAKVVYYCDCDVLASFKTAIGDSSMYVIRSASANNPMLIDTLYPLTTEHVLSRHSITSPWTVGKDGFWFTGTFVVGIRSENGVQYWAFTNNILAWQNFLNDILSEDLVNNFITAWQVQQSPQLKMLVDPLQYIDSVVWFPFSITGTAVTTIPFANTSLINQNAIPMASFTTLNAYTSTFDFTVPFEAHPQIARGDYLNSANFTQVSLCAPPFGKFNLDMNKVRTFNDNLSVIGHIYVDLRTGSAQLTVDAQVTNAGGVTTKYTNLAMAQAQVGISIPLSQTIAQGGISTVETLSVIGDAVSSVLHGNIFGAITGVMGAVESEAKAKIPEVRHTGQTSAITSLYGLDGFYVDYDFSIVADDDITQRGQPLCEVRQLSTLSGYQLIADADIHINGTADEARQIKSILEQGYFYE